MARKGKDAKPPKTKKTAPGSTPASKPKAKALASKTTRKMTSAKATEKAPKATARYDDLKPAPPPVLGNLPWGYGDNRICTMARDPQWAYCYWEFTDAGMTDARAKLGNPNEWWISLRIYDTTGRDFNGLNAHLHWDISVDRGTNGYYIRVGKPGATVIVDVGVSAPGGAFYPIARSGPCEMPRDHVSARGGIEATTVLRSGPGYNYKHRYVAPPRGPEPEPGPAPSSDFVQATHPADSDQFFQHLAGEGWAKQEWTETMMDGRVVRWIKWAGPVAAEHLHYLPKTGGAFHSVEVLFQGERRIIKFEGGEKVVFGPWRVTLEAVGTKGERRTIEQWMIKRRWTTQEGMMRVETPAILTRILGGRRVIMIQSGSESRLAHDQWGSEHLMRGASEWRWIGASENLAQGSSESVHLGASERAYLGSSETVHGGASEMLYLGASDSFAFGSSDLTGGSSENRP